MRVLAAANLARTVGTGILLSTGILYFVKILELPIGRVGIGLSCAAVLGMLSSVPAGHLADVFGARTTSIVFVALQGAAACGYIFVGGFGGLLVAAGAAAVADAAANAARGALVAAVMPQPDRVRARAYLRSATNVGVSVGAVIGGVALGDGRRAAFVVVLLIAGACFAVGGLTYLALPAVRPRPRPVEGSRLVALRDRPFLGMTLVNAVLVMNGGILTIALPIWISEHTSAPAMLYSALLLVNTVLVIALQVRMSRDVTDVPRGAAALRRAGLLLAVCCLIFPLSSGVSTGVAVAIVTVGVLVHVVGELLHSAGSWAVSYELAPDHAQGQYQGLFGLGAQLGSAVMPSAATALIIGYGWLGWLGFAALMAAAGLVAPTVARIALRSRAPVPVQAWPAAV
jgi:MFS family permease